MMGSRSTSDLSSTLEILKSLADPVAAAETIKAQLAVAQDIEAKREALEIATAAHNNAAMTAQAAEAALRKTQKDLAVQHDVVTSSIQALAADKERFGVEQAEATSTHMARLTELHERREAHQRWVLATEQTARQRELALEAREAEAVRVATKAERAIAVATAAEARADARAAEHQERLDAIRKAAGL